MEQTGSGGRVTRNCGPPTPGPAGNRLLELKTDRRMASSTFMAATDFKTTVMTSLHQLGREGGPKGPEALLVGESADGALWWHRIRRRYWILESGIVVSFIRKKALERIAIVVPDRVAVVRIVLLDRTDPISAGTGQKGRVERLASAARRAWGKAQ